MFSLIFYFVAICHSFHWGVTSTLNSCRTWSYRMIAKIRRTPCVTVHQDPCACCDGQGMRQEVATQVGELQSDDMHDAQDAAEVLLELSEGCDGGSEAAVPAAVVALGALPALWSLAHRLPTKKPVQQLLHFCCIARETVRLRILDQYFRQCMPRICAHGGQVVLAPLPTGVRRYIWRYGIATAAYFAVWNSGGSGLFALC